MINIVYLVNYDILDDFSMLILLRIGLKHSEKTTPDHNALASWFAHLAECENLVKRLASLPLSS